MVQPSVLLGSLLHYVVNRVLLIEAALVLSGMALAGSAQVKPDLFRAHGTCSDVAVQGGRRADA